MMLLHAATRIVARSSQPTLSMPPCAAHCGRDRRVLASCGAPSFPLMCAHKVVGT